MPVSETENGNNNPDHKSKQTASLVTNSTFPILKKIRGGQILFRLYHQSRIEET